MEVYTTEGVKTQKSVKLAPEIFGIEPNDHAIYMAVKAQMTNSHRGTASTKGRSEVRGGGRKPWRQKGTGRARAGTIRSPLWRGGGTVFGPTPHPYSMKINKKVKQLARKSALAYKARENQLLIVEDFDIESGKTRDMYRILQNLNVEDKKTLLLIPEKKELLQRAGRNIPNLIIRRAADASTYDLLNCDILLIQKSALRALQEVLKA